MKIAGVVLAGGLSSRMGKDKTQLILENKTLLARTVNLLEQLPLDAVFVSGEQPGYNCIADIYRYLGPLSGIHASVESLSATFDAIFVIPVDMPLLSLAECTFLLNKLTQYPQGVFYQASIFPFILPLNRAVQDYLSAIMTDNDKKARSLYRLFTTFSLQGVDCAAAQSFRFQNSNTPEEWDNCLYTYHNLPEYKDKP